MTPIMDTRKPTLLISDDDPALAAVISRYAQAIGFETVCDTKSNVVALARAFQPDLILLDLRQQVDGRDLLASLKRDPLTREVKVVVLAGVEDQHTRHLCFELGAIDYEVEPFDPFIGRKLLKLLEGSPTRH